MSVLEALARADHATVRSLASATGDSISSTHRLLLSLKAAGMVVDNASSGYRLAPRALSLALRVPIYRALHERAPVALQAVSHLGLPPVLALRDDMSVFYLLSSGPGGQRPPSRPGDIRPMHCTASGKCCSHTAHRMASARSWRQD
ncbi:helix-turn-helix domain-containing protein [Paenarthrobacter sp. PAE-2]|uniref:helix-turn-helix domain-containing protein n=1 Tax=Paenarthrobacter sp. PAE-2 TaxID=2982532 RepID=UPI0039B6F95C